MSQTAATANRRTGTPDKLLSRELENLGKRQEAAATRPHTGEHLVRRRRSLRTRAITRDADERDQQGRGRSIGGTVGRGRTRGGNGTSGSRAHERGRARSHETVPDELAVVAVNVDPFHGTAHFDLFTGISARGGERGRTCFEVVEVGWWWPRGRGERRGVRMR